MKRKEDGAVRRMVRSFMAHAEERTDQVHPVSVPLFDDDVARAFNQRLQDRRFDEILQEGKKHPEHPLVRNQMGISYSVSGRLTEALQEYLYALVQTASVEFQKHPPEKIRTLQSWILNNISTWLDARNLLKDGLAVSEVACCVDPENNVVGYWSRVQHHMLAGDEDKACAVVEDFLHVLALAEKRNPEAADAMRQQARRIYRSKEQLETLRASNRPRTAQTRRRLIEALHVDEPR